MRAMEGMERRNIEQRLECLSNINALLDAAMLQIGQYVTVARTQSFPGYVCHHYYPARQISVVLICQLNGVSVRRLLSLYTFPKITAFVSQLYTCAI